MNHRIFTLRCVNKDLVPVSIKLKTTIKTEKARKITRKAERDLLQARVKSINSILGDNAKQRELFRSQLVSMLSTSASTMNKCQQFIDKVSELRFIKVRERQINKFNRLLQNEEGNITWLVPTNTPANSTLLAVSASSPQAGNTSSQAISIASSQTGSQLANNNR